MIRLISIVFLLAILSCKEDKINTAALDCYSQYKDLRRGEFVVDAPVTVQLSGGLALGKQLKASNGVSWGGCNLPAQFAQDSLAIYVTGYFLTSKELETMNLTPLPFEIISAKHR
ncbi:hypothetical protein [Dyadobacter sp. CY312]|uniref:hypothetical protein n=1 Tax=Dyadobacter sp. CY312 TaxID=2907303 RepID=UPI001F44C4CF|nr:hypothetical protein [Dyadobacter sp. CY312]MCE7038924.1 hypothetical protein [Dyadobacter sp. CY312]